MIADPTAIPETVNDVEEYRAAMEEAVAANDDATAMPLAHAIGESNVADNLAKGRAGFVEGQGLEADGRIDDAIDAYRRSGEAGNADGTAAKERLLAGETAGPLEAAHIPENEAEADKYYMAGRRAHDSGDHERAYELFLAVYNSGINNAGQTGQAAHMLALACQASGDHDAAYQYFRQASEMATPAIRELAHAELSKYNAADGSTAIGQEHASSEQLESAEAVATMLQAAVDRYDNNDLAGAESRFTAAHGSSSASSEQKGYAAYYLGVLAWNADNYDVARVHFRAAKDSAESTLAGQAAQMLQTHWGENS